MFFSGNSTASPWERSKTLPTIVRNNLVGVSLGKLLRRGDEPLAAEVRNGAAHRLGHAAIDRNAGAPRQEGRRDRLF